MEKLRVLFVCLGNICRSPLGEAILKQKLNKAGLQIPVEVDSCGTSNYHIGDLADPRTIANAKKNGVAITHRARQIHESDLSTFDLILAMDKNNLKSILELPGASQYKDKIFLIRSFDPTSDGDEVPDPYYGNEKGFQLVFDILDGCGDYFIHYIRDKYTSLPHQ